MDVYQDDKLSGLGVTHAEFLDYTVKHQAGLYLLVAGSTFITYDYFLTLSNEFVFIWKRNTWTHLTTILFLINRYFPMATIYARCISYLLDATVTDGTCPYFYGLNFSAWSSVISMATMETVLFLRIWLLYNRSRKVGIYLVVVLVTGSVTGLVIRRVEPGRGVPLVVPYPPELVRCPRSHPAEFFWLYLTAFITQVLGGILLFRKSWGIWQNRFHMPFISALLRQGVWYYIAIWGIMVLTLASTMIPGIYLPLADANIIVPLSSVACNRLVLSLQEQWSPSREVTSVNGQTTVPVPRQSGVHMVTETFYDGEHEGHPVNIRMDTMQSEKWSSGSHDTDQGGIRVSRAGKGP